MSARITGQDGVPLLLPLVYEPVLRAALAEDLGRAGDITSAAVIPEAATASARIVARRAGVVAGLDVAAAVFRIVDPSIRVSLGWRAGDGVEAGALLAAVDGPARGVLAAERVALNVLGRLCGIATLTRAFVEAVAGTGARITDTRKTTPLLRALEKHAVLCGGGSNHRFGLDDAVLIKDNHVAVAGGVAEAVRRARAHVGHMVVVSVEVTALDQIDELLAMPAQRTADVVLLDNMDTATLREAVRRIDGRFVTEASGGITLATAHEMAATGVNYLSVGALTHSAAVLDVALDVVVA